MKVEIENKAEMVQSSVDVAQYKKERMVYLVLCAIAAAVIIGISTYSGSIGLLPVLVMVVLAFLLMMVFYRHKIRSITIDPERYDFYETKLIDADQRGGKNVCFSVEIELANGEMMRADTNTICATGGNMKPHYSRFENRKALIAYDEELAQVVVVELL